LKQNQFKLLNKFPIVLYVCTIFALKSLEKKDKNNFIFFLQFCVRNSSRIAHPNMLIVVNVSFTVQLRLRIIINWHWTGINKTKLSLFFFNFVLSQSDLFGSLVETQISYHSQIIYLNKIIS